MSSPLVDLLGEEKLQGKEGSLTTASALEGKEVLGLYFSAHWCPPCRMFTPMLAGWYSKLVGEGKAVEVVFVSSDKDQGSFDEYYAEHPWKALPFEDRDAKNRLSAKFKVRGIPALIFLDVATGQVINAKGREAVMGDPIGAKFPYRPKPLSELLQGPLTDREGKATTVAEALSGKEHVMLYFSASWCPPCQRFTPLLAKIYEGFKERGRTDVEAIFVSSDRDQASFNGYMQKHPWKAIPFGDPRIRELSTHFEVEGIPTLVVLDKDLKVINAEAVQAASTDPSGVEFPWAPKPLTDLSQGGTSAGFSINDKPSLMALMEGADDEEQGELTAALLSLALEESSKDEPDVIFFTNTGQSELGDRIRQLMKLGSPGASPQIIIANVSDDGAFYLYNKGEDFSESAIRAFADDFKHKRLTRQQMGR